MREEQIPPATSVTSDLSVPVPTGEEHWQEQRKAWLSGPGTPNNRDDVPSPLHLVFKESGN